MTDPCTATAVELIAAMRDGAQTAVAVMQAHLDRVEALEPTIRAWAHRDREAAMSAAAVVDAKRQAGAPLGPLHGLPVGVKDIVDTADLPTTYGTRVHAGRRPQADATIVARLRAAGAIVAGKTVTSEYALYIPGPTRNPHDLTRTPGGSSSGSAAAVAAGMVPVALATQTNGSTVRPASFCGIVGYKPSLGLLPRTGILRQVTLLDQPGLMARSVGDVALFARVLGGRDPADEMSFDPFPDDWPAPSEAAPKLAFVRGPFWNRADITARAAIEAFVGRCGFPIVSIDLPAPFAAAADLTSLLMEAGIAEAYADDARTAPTLMPELVFRTIERGRTHFAVSLLNAVAERARLRRLFDTIAAPYDALLTPAAVGVAPPFETGTGDPIFATTWTLLGVPAITLPLLRGDQDLPLGLQLVTGSRRDGDLLRAAAWLTQFGA